MIKLRAASIYPGDQLSFRFKIRVLVIGIWPFKNLVIGWKPKSERAEWIRPNTDGKVAE